MLIEDFFRLKELGTNIRTEAVAGVTTFMAMAYIKGAVLNNIIHDKKLPHSSIRR